MVNSRVAVLDAESMTWMVKVKDPGVVGVPEMVVS
jgi:hypothetical protein